MDLCKRRYSNRYDAMTSEAWLRNIVLKGPLMFLAVRTADAFLIAVISVVPWLPGRPDCNVAFICAEDGAHWQAMRLLRFSIQWARDRRCATWHVSSDTAHEVGALATRLGAHPISPRYELEL